jgi:regulator of protease activity HflC (stomatin/prohibitin superfamily)
LALRAVVGARELDAFLADKDAVAKEIEQALSGRAGESLGLEIASVGIRDVILPGDMKDLMNKVTEAKKAAEANLIAAARRRRPCAARPTRPSCWRQPDADAAPGTGSPGEDRPRPAS